MHIQNIRIYISMKFHTIFDLSEVLRLEFQQGKEKQLKVTIFRMSFWKEVYMVKYILRKRERAISFLSILAYLARL